MSCCLKYIVGSPEILSHVARNFIECINLKKSNISSKSKGINSQNVDSLTYANMKLNKDSNIAVHFSVVSCYELSSSFYSKDSSNYVARNFIECINLKGLHLQC